MSENNSIPSSTFFEDTTHLTLDTLWEDFTTIQDLRKSKINKSKINQYSFITGLIGKEIFERTINSFYNTALYKAEQRELRLKNLKSLSI